MIWACVSSDKYVFFQLDLLSALFSWCHVDLLLHAEIYIEIQIFVLFWILNLPLDNRKLNPTPFEAVGHFYFSIIHWWQFSVSSAGITVTRFLFLWRMLTLQQIPCGWIPNLKKNQNNKINKQKTKLKKKTTM